MKYIMNIIIILLMPFIFLGIINKVKSFWAGRKGPSVIQPLHDFIKLIRKGEVISTGTSGVFILAPIIGVFAVLMASLIVPLGDGIQMISFKGDIILFVYMLGLSKFAIVIGAMDTGSSFEGMGAAREAFFTSYAEPAMFLVFCAATLVTGSFSFSGVVTLIQLGNNTMVLLAMISAVVFLIIMFVEGSRLPVDDPNTHLELTMIHEVMLLDNSGPNLAISMYAAGLKTIIFASVIAAVAIPSGMSYVMSIVVYFAAIIVLAMLTGCVESLMARFRLTHIPQFVYATVTLGMTAFAIGMLILSGGGV